MGSVKPSARERATALQPSLDAARTEVAQLEAALKAAEQRAHDAYAAGDVPGGDAAHAEAAATKPRLEAARAHLETLAGAAEVVAKDKHREELEDRLEAARKAAEIAVAEAEMHAAEVKPLMSAARRELVTAMGYQDQAGRKQAEVLELEVALGLRERARVSASSNAVTAMVESQPLMLDLLRCRTL